MTVVVLRDVAPRFAGFLASCMLEIAPGVYTAPRMTAGVRDRVWSVLEEWFDTLGGGGVLMTWNDASTAAGQSIRTLGIPARVLVDVDGFVLTRSGRAPQERVP